MTPDETRRDAVDAAREWSAEERSRRRAGVKGPAGELPQRGELIDIVWPDSDHDFKMIFQYEDRHMSAPPGWTYLHGQIVSPPEWRRRPWSFMVRWHDGAWTMLPRNGKLSDVQGASTEIDSTPPA